MSKTLSRAIVFAIAVVFATAPFVFAQATGTPPSPGTQERMGTGATPGGTQEHMGTMGAQDTIHATVADVNHQHNTLKLRMQGGETVEFKVPEASLTNLNKGDSVQVSIRKAERQSSMSPGTTSPGTKSR